MNDGFNAPNLRRHIVSEVTVQVLLGGERLDESFSKSDNSLVIPTDTTNNTVYILAKQSKSTLETLEVFAKEIISHYLTRYNHVDIVSVKLLVRSLKSFNSL